ncbi:hypothetical protein DYE50_01155 [Treponema ruminis]|uniref:Stomatal closure-related actin-binding protein Ig domain-containing protein n=1 Tax=Treponema ruminis TaxID=744515 RepID=A0A7W8GBC4_9SPIR|nr:hypothetical protein [Treponema ruminis]MBB5227295.1 hypothetical protein [Treponema ruminis]QSI01191.1 hypothetical protein DYE50_01155 [Treponema ruminis]
MKNRIRFLSAGFSILIFVLALLFASCSDIVQGDSGDENISSSEASVSFRITSKFAANSRTALPSIDFTQYLYEIKAKNSKSGAEKSLAQNLNVDDLSSQKFAMTRSKWIFYILAYAINESGEPEEESVFEGESEEIDLANSATATVTMPLRASTIGFGSVRIPLKYAASGVAKVTCGLYTSATGGELVDGKELVTFEGSEITKGDDGFYSLVFEDNEVPSGSLVYARFVLYDKNDIAVGYYTEAVYVAKDKLSEPEIFVKNEDGTYQKDENGNPVKDTSGNASVEVEPNLFPASVTAQKDKKVFAETTVKEDETEKTVVYELNDEDGDGIYDTVLPPGNYTIKVGELTDTAETAKQVEDSTLDVSTKGGSVAAEKLNEVTLSGQAKTGTTITAKAISSKNVDISDSVKWQWYRDNEAIEGATQNTYKVTPEDVGKVLKAVASQDDKGKTKTKDGTSEKVEKGSLASKDFTISYDGKEFSVADGKASPKDGKLIFTKGSDSLTVESAKLSSGTLKDQSGNEITPEKVTFVNSEGKEISSDTLDSSKTLTVKIEAQGYEPELITLYVTVKAGALSPEPKLSTDIENLHHGDIAFAEPIPDGAEYSTDGGKTWTDLSTNSFAPPANETDKILVRTKAVGEEGKDGYIAPSDAKEISFSSENKGEKVVEIKEDGITLNGASKEDEVLSVKVIGEDESDLTDSSLIEYQWYAADDATSEGSPIEGATGKDFTPGENEVGKILYVKVTYTNPKSQDLTVKDSPRTEKIVAVKVKTPTEAEIPSFAEDKSKVQEGKVQFKVTDEQTGKYEYSTDGGETWKPLTDEAITVDGDSILVRAAAQGTEGGEGYLAPSNPVTISVKEQKGTFTLDDLTTEYDGGALSGDKPLASKVLLKYADGSSPDSESGFTVTFKEDKAITESSNVAITISKEGFEPYEASVYVPVKAKEPQESEIPVLSTDKGNISGGCLKFEPTEAQTGKFEYSTDGGTTWKTLTNEEFDAPESPNKLLVRSKEQGTSGQPGYIAPSDAVEVAYSDNIGQKPVITVKVSLGGDIEVKEAEPDSNIVLTAADGYSSYEWKIDGKSLTSSTTWATASGGTLKLSKNDMKTGSYTITVVGKKNGIDYNTSITVTKE